MASQTTSSTTLSRENFLEKKIQILDKRLTQVEKFIELRFRGRTSDGYSDNENDNFRETSSSKKPGRRPAAVQKPARKVRKDSDRSWNEDDDDVDVTLPTRSSTRQKQQQSEDSGSSAKKQKPGPASVKRKREEEEATLNANKKFQGIKDCVIRVERTEIPSPKVDAPVTSSSRGRPRRTPKRYQDESDEDEKTKTRESLRSKRRGEEAAGNVVKTEAEDSFEIEESGGYGGDDDFFGGDGPPSPVGNDHVEFDNDSGGEGGYFTFPGEQTESTPIPAGRGRRAKGKRQEKKDEDSFEMDDNDANWSAPEGDDGNDDDEDYEAETPEKKTPTTTGRRRGRKPGSGRKKGKRSYTKLDLKELPSDSMVTSDPSLKLCHLCNWHFKVEAFDAHLESHARERHLQCPECGKAYYNQFTLKKHMKTHDPEKYTKKCRQCTKPFLHSDKLLAHERYCVKKALENNESVDPNLIEDLKSRTKNTSWIYEAMEVGSKRADESINPDERKQCPHCNKNFKLRVYDRHILSHTKPKHWSCSMCDKAYHYKHDLVRHVAMDHVITPKCDMCEKTFENREQLKAHAVECRRKHRKSLKYNSVQSTESTSNSSKQDEASVKVEKVEKLSQQEEDEGDCLVQEENLETVEVEEQVEEEVILFDDGTSTTPALGLVGGHDSSEVVQTDEIF